MPFDPPMAQKKITPKATDSRPTLVRRKVHRIVFVTGKGGVGKSAVAAATALQFARAGKTVLLVELGSRSFYGPLLGLPVGADTVPWTSGIGIARWDVESSLREYMAHYLVFKAAADWLLNYTVMKALMAAAPSLAELSILGKLTGPMRHDWYRRDVDVVVVDAYCHRPVHGTDAGATRHIADCDIRARCTDTPRKSPHCCASRRSANTAW